MQSPEQKFGRDELRAILEAGKSHPRHAEVMAYYKAYNREQAVWIDEMAAAEERRTGWGVM
jgi:hypothetical protein